MNSILADYEADRGRINAAGLAIVKLFEGWSAVPYHDPAGITTIGYGSTWTVDGKPITIDHPMITRAQGEELLRAGLQEAEQAVQRLIHAPLNPNEFSALTSFTYNVGSGNFHASTMRMKLNRCEYAAAAMEFPKWRRSGGMILAGLVRRRIAERGLFLSRLTN